MIIFFPTADHIEPCMESMVFLQKNTAVTIVIRSSNHQARLDGITDGILWPVDCYQTYPHLTFLTNNIKLLFLYLFVFCLLCKTMSRGADTRVSQFYQECGGF